MEMEMKLKKEKVREVKEIEVEKVNEEDMEMRRMLLVEDLVE
jgi:hypothetical protein